MNAHDVAAELSAWSVRQGIVANYLVDERPHAPRNLFGPVPIEEQKAANILSAAGISDIVYGDEHVIVFHPKRLLKRDEKALPQKINGVMIEYRKSTGEIIIDEKVAEMAAGVLPAVDVSGHFTCGSSIGIGPISAAGTLGALVTDETGTLFGLTNNHVIGGCNHMPASLPVVAPGPIDMRAGGLDPFCAGHHAQSVAFHIGIPGVVPYQQNVDAAIFRIRDSNTVSSMQRHAFDTPTRTLAPVTGMRVRKAGRTSGITSGTIVGRAYTATPVTYDLPQVGFKGNAYFTDVYLVEGAAGAPFAARGDSGALVVCYNEDGSMAAVGLVFAVAGDRTFITPIDRVLTALGVTLVTGHNSRSGSGGAAQAA